MNTPLRTATIAAFALLAIAASSLASASDKTAPPADAITMEQALQTLKDAGYTDIREIEYERGAWEARGVDASGKKAKIYVDAKTGAITVKEKRTDKDRADKDWADKNWKKNDRDGRGNTPETAPSNR